MSHATGREQPAPAEEVHSPSRSRRRWIPGPGGGERTRPASEGESAGIPALALASILGGTTIALAWWVPETYASALLGWVSASLLVFNVRSRRSYLPAYVHGLFCYALGFYWVFGTVASFGGYGAGFSALVFALFVATGAVQFLVFAFLHHNLGPRFDALALRAPCALVLSEFASVRLFRWHHGHTQVAFTPFVQVADLGGSLLVSFLLFWVAEVVVRAIAFRERRRSFFVPLVACGLALAYGYDRMLVFSAPAGRRQEVVLIQSNITLDQERGPGAALRNVERLRALSRKASRPGALIVWPEGAISLFLPAEVRSVRDEPALPWIGDGSAFLVGSYAEDRQGKRYNAAFAVHPDGTVAPPYYKQVLIPFGEYMPFTGVFPWLRRLNDDADVFTAGGRAEVFEIPVQRAGKATPPLKVSPLICYEDTVPGPSREASLGGAELLVNLTYDTWFGRSAAPHEHHLIAAFRAIENRRFLVRATNTGLSAVVDPLGKTVARLPMFSEGTVAANVVLLDDQTLYARHVRERPWWALLAVCLPVAAVRRHRSRRR